MANVEPIVIQQLLAEVESLERALKGVGEMKTNKLKRSKISEVRSAVIGGTAFDANRWSELGADKQSQLLKRLTLIRDELLHVNGTDAARPSDYFVQEDGVSKRAIIWLAVFGSIFAATLLSLIR